MKNTKHICISLLLFFVFILSSCGKEEPEMTPIIDIGTEYTSDAAMSEGAVIFEDGDIVSGEDIFAEFEENCRRMETDGRSRDDEYYMVRIYNVYNGTAEGYPKFHVTDIYFDGETYKTWEYDDDGKEILGEYKYMMRCENDAPNEYTGYKKAVRYYLTNDEDFSYEEYMRAILSLTSSISYPIYSGNSGGVVRFFDAKQIYADLIR